MAERLARRHADHAAQQARDSSFLLKPAALKDGTRIELTINVAGVEELDHIDPACCDGIGLMRSEFLFRDGAPLPDEDEQYRAYRRFVEWAGGRPVTIRTLDIGGDKPVRGLTPEGEANPFLGLRGVRLTLARRGCLPHAAARPGPRRGAWRSQGDDPDGDACPTELAQTAALLDARDGRPAARRRCLPQATARHHGGSARRRRGAGPVSTTRPSSPSVPMTSRNT